MRKVLVLAEGPTEERFVKEALNPHFQTRQLYLQPVIVATKRVNAGGKFKGGVPSADSDESGHLFQSISDTIPGLSDSCRSEATL